VITKEQYFGKKQYPIEHEANADWMLAAVNLLLHHAVQEGAYDYWTDPDTGTQISGSKGGAGDGGYRTVDSKTGSPRSSHKLAKAVDVYDPDNKLDDWVTDEILIKYNLYREHPDYTNTWVHLSTKPPGSGLRTFRPY